MSGRKTTRKRQKRADRPSEAELDEMIEQAIVDAYDQTEQTMGFFVMLEDCLALPFKTEVLGVEVTVERIEVSDKEQIVAVCSRGKSKQRLPILDLPLPRPPPAGAEWIAAYGRWARGGNGCRSRARTKP